MGVVVVVVVVVVIAVAVVIECDRTVDILANHSMNRILC